MVQTYTYIFSHIELPVNILDDVSKEVLTYYRPLSFGIKFCSPTITVIYSPWQRSCIINLLI